MYQNWVCGKGLNTHWSEQAHEGTVRRIYNSSWAQPGYQSIYQLLLLGPSGPNSKLFTGLLQHGHGQLSQGAVLHVGPQLIFWHLHFGLFLSSAPGISCERRRSVKMKVWFLLYHGTKWPKQSKKCISKSSITRFNSLEIWPFGAEQIFILDSSPDLFCVWQLVCPQGCSPQGRPDL